MINRLLPKETHSGVSETCFTAFSQPFLRTGAVQLASFTVKIVFGYQCAHCVRFQFPVRENLWQVKLTQLPYDLIEKRPLKGLKSNS